MIAGSVYPSYITVPDGADWATTCGCDERPGRSRGVDQKGGAEGRGRRVVGFICILSLNGLDCASNSFDSYDFKLHKTPKKHKKKNMFLFLVIP